MSRKTIPDIRAAKGKAPLVAVTAYTAPFARTLDEHVDILLVGDSVGMAVYGMPNTLGVTLEMMLAHGAAVARASSQALVVVDMPFGSYQESPEQAYRNGARVLTETGAQAVKIEGGMEMAETIRFLTARAIPVVAHVGMMPQHVHSMGGWRCQGMHAADRAHILEDAQSVQHAGAFAVVIENVEESLAVEITKKLAIPTIGIGASPQCDGQVLVCDDLVGLSPKAPRFAKQYADFTELLGKIAADYAADVRDRRFPAPEHVRRKE